MSRELLLSIARCEIAKQVLNDAEAAHCCARIVLSQEKNAITPQRVPEPWNGQLTSARLLFVASNPAISGTELYPDSNWGDDRLVEFFEGRFGDKDQSPISSGGRCVLNINGTRDRANPFLSSIRMRALELGLERPGIDYAVTEVVHCKSRSEKFGVKDARSICADRYFREVLAAAGARVFVLLGRHAAWAAVKLLDVTPGSVMQRTYFGGQERMTVILPHPNARGKKKSLIENIGATRMAELKAYLASE
jgi:hypothetical protein